ncbi:unnamed protein product [Coccothraustes coccothraustes]
MLALREAEHTNLKLPEVKRQWLAALCWSRALESTATGTLLERVEKHAVKMQALREAEHANLKLPEAKGRSRAAFSRRRALESTATGTMLSGRRSRFFASGSRRERPLLRRKDRSRT